jgi:hypothetical protein
MTLCSSDTVPAAIMLTFRIAASLDHGLSHMRPPRQLCQMASSTTVFAPEGDSTSNANVAA